MEALCNLHNVEDTNGLTTLRFGEVVIAITNTSGARLADFLRAVQPHAQLADTTLPKECLVCDLAKSNMPRYEHNLLVRSGVFSLGLLCLLKPTDLQRSGLPLGPKRIQNIQDALEGIGKSLAPE